MGTLKLRRPRTALAAGLATLAMAASLATVPAQAADKVKYIALGDSFAAGQGAGPYQDTLCYRSENTYSELAADTKAVKLVRNAACSGKTTQDVASTQLRQLNKSTELVTITAGGNNLKFGDIVTKCGAALANPTPITVGLCDEAGAYASGKLASGQLAAEVAAMIQSVQAAAPRAKIVVTGYPYLYNPVPLDPDDQTSVFINKATGLAFELNKSIAAAAEYTKVQFVDVTGAFAGHGINSKYPWINGGANPGPDSFHPNALGYKAYYAALTKAGAYSAR